MRNMKKCSRCGEIKPLSGFSEISRIKSGYSSWCKECNNKHSREFSKTPSGIYTTIKGRVKFRNKFKNYHSLSISREDFIRWYNEQNKNCIYCSISEEELQTLPDQFNNNSKRLTIDCKDSKNGYSKGNIVLACWRCNIIKGDLLSFDEMMYIGQNFIKPKWKALRGSLNNA